MKKRCFRGLRGGLTWLLTVAAILGMLVPGTAAAEVPADKLSQGVAEAVDLGLVPEALLQEEMDMPVTRGEFCALLYQASDRWGEVEPVPVPSFSDTTEAAVAACAGLGIVNGYPDGTFRPEGQLTRQQAAAMLHRAAEAFALPDSQVKFPHNWQDPVADWSYADASWCYFNGIMEGTGDNRFSGNSLYTRAQAIVTVLRLDRLARGQGEKKTEYYPIYSEILNRESPWRLDGLTGWLSSDGLWLTEEEMLAEHPDARAAALENWSLIDTPNGIPTSKLLPKTFLGDGIYYHNVDIFMKTYGWFTDIYGNPIEVPGIGYRFGFMELYYGPDGSLMANIGKLLDPDELWSFMSGEMIYYNLTTGEQLDGPGEFGDDFEQEGVTFCAEGSGVYAIEGNGGSISVYGAMPEPVQLDLAGQDGRLMGFCQGLMVVEVDDQLWYYSPFGPLITRAE